LYTAPDGRDLVAMDSRRRLFGGLLRRMLVLRDDVCTTPWCEAPIVHADHTTPARDGGRTGYEDGNGKCARCNQTKEAPGWRTRVVLTEGRQSVHNGDRRARQAERVTRRVVQVTTPLGHQYQSEPPPLLGWGSENLALQLGGNEVDSPTSPVRRTRSTPAQLGGDNRGRKSRPPTSDKHRTGEPGPAHRRKRPLRRERVNLRGPVPPRPRRPRVTSHLERQLCRYLT